MFILIGIPLFQSFNPAFALRLNSKLPPPRLLSLQSFTEKKGPYT